ncbi:MULTISPECIES: DUF3383 family protein [unclassified Saccharibacter]|uniref:DUF3383 family protein n=1 Tax=unclassified Saccharibacter TaxID=2648722 RepID=UPI00132C3891|nr:MULTISPECIES: DUF3383 family protein [unclassified Saccharibacter]MXV35674.1 DUF3383 family protein [Saccharibacter sp. EH611]MXV58288.1 DUF3383 family protein [Saccharibacter sp. EH70]MXV66415.1 DUF3383 family protein [Saccharibacter sp. EH60]
MSIPLSALVSVHPSVVQTGAGQNNLYGLMLSQSPNLPFGRTLSFSNADDVGTLLGKNTLEYQQAALYFGAYTGATNRPAVLTMAHFPSDLTTPIQASLWGGSLAGMTLHALQQVKGTLSLSVNGAVLNVPVDLSGCQSFSDAAHTLSTDLFPSGGGAVAWNVGLSNFVITAPSQPLEEGASSPPLSSITPAAGTVADALGLSPAKGGVVTPALPLPSVGAVMDLIRAYNPTWASFFCAFDPKERYKDFAAWVNSQNDSCMGILHDSALDGMTASALNQAITAYDAVTAAHYSGIFGLNNDPLTPAFVSSIYASVDFTQKNGMLPFAGRTSSGLIATVTDRAIAEALEAKGINYVGDYTGPDDTDLTQLQAGFVSGDFAWADAYMGQIWFNRRMQHLLSVRLRAPQSIPYTRAGDTMIEAVLLPAIQDALNFGLITQGVVLSEDEQLTLSSEFGANTLQALQTAGYVTLVAMEKADPAIRGKRQTVPVTVLYTQGGSVQRLSLNSIEVQ